jgi:hypothetical protein
VGEASDRLNRKLADYTKELGLRHNRASKKLGEVLLAESEKVVPRDTAALVRSGVTRQDGASFNTVTIVGYGAPGQAVSGLWSAKEQKYVTRDPSEYAVAVHEGAYGRYYGEGGFSAEQGSFFLSQPIMLSKETYLAAYNVEIVKYS